MRTCADPSARGSRRRRSAGLVLTLALVAGVACTADPSDADPSRASSTPSSSAPSSSSPSPSAPATTPMAPDSASPHAASPGSPSPSAPGSSAPVATTPADPPTGPAGFIGTVAPLDRATAARMTTSWRTGCPVPLSDLRLLTVTYRGFDGADHPGEMVVAASVADDVVAIFRRLYEIAYPIESMRLVDDFGGSDDASMAANNTSAFNCRPVTGGGGYSEHSYGTAIDVNPVQNPYVRGSTVLPPAGAAFVDRPAAPGVIHPDDEVVRAFAIHGFQWGGSWLDPVDYQHFSVSGR